MRYFLSMTSFDFSSPQFDVDLGLKTPTYKFPYLKVGMWDKDILKYDDLIAEASLDVGYYVKKAFRQSNYEDKKLLPVKVWEDPPKQSSKSLSLSGGGGGGFFGGGDDGPLVGELQDVPFLEPDGAKVRTPLPHPPLLL